MKHLYFLGVLVGRASTRKTRCGKRVPERELALCDEEADCEECRANEDKELAGILYVYDSVKDNCTNSKLLAELRESIAVWTKNKYKNRELLRTL